MAHNHSFTVVYHQAQVPPPLPRLLLVYLPTLAFDVSLPLSAGASAGQDNLQDEISDGVIDITPHLNINAEQWRGAAASLRMLEQIDPFLAHCSRLGGDNCRCSRPLI